MAETPLDFDTLRARALRTLQGLAGSRWTDHNSHDPGITLLEQLCYGLTDLGYRSGFALADLLCEVERAPDLPPAQRLGLFGPEQVLPGGPVTLDDLRRLVVDIPGVANAWVEPVDLPLGRYDAAQGLLWAESAAGVVEAARAGADAAPGTAAPAAASPNVVPLRPAGLVRVRIDKSVVGADVDGGELVRQAASRLQAWRGLGEDLVDIAVLDRQPVALDAALELAPGADGAAVLAEACTAIAEHLAPPLRFKPLRALLDAGWPVDRIFEGPPMTRGFLEPAPSAQSQRRSTVRLSDLVQVLTALPGVQAVKRIAFLRDGRPVADWLLPIAPERSARFDLAGSRLQLEQAGMRIDHAAMRASARRLYELRLRRDAQEPPERADASALVPPPGRRRHVGDYLSVQHHLPAVYGVGPSGLSDDEPPERHAWARQLKAYLLLFDQLLANQHAQLAAAGRLLGFDDAGDAVRFAQPVPDDGGALLFDRVRLGTPEAHAEALLLAVHDPWGDGSADDQALAQRHRLVDHLLARLGETWSEQRPVPGSADADADPEALPAAQRRLDLRRKQAWLHDYPRLALRRGVGAQAMAAPGEAPPPPGIVQRLARLLGWSETDPALTLVEHILLRPLPGDAFQQGPLMRGLAQRDPFSLQLSLVLPSDDPRLADDALRQRLLQLLQAEAPAHLGVRLLLLDAAAHAAFLAAHGRWRALWAAARRADFGLQAAEDRSGAAGHQTALRSARNRVIDALGLADTCPLTDLVVAEGRGAEPIKVAYGRSARIAIDGAEAGVRYALRGPGGAPLRDNRGNLLPEVAADGHDGRLLLDSPPVTDDISYRVQATKLHPSPGQPPQPPVLLAQAAAVRVGLDTRLPVELAGLPLLDPTLATPTPADARLAGHGEAVTVLVHASQEGVAYRLVLDDRVQDAAVVGNLATIVLVSPPLAEDTVIAVQATKAVGGGAADQQLLDARLRVAVRADATPPLQLLPGPVVAHRAGEAVLRLTRSQASAGYRVWLRRVQDDDWLRGEPGVPALPTGVTGLAVAASVAARDRVPPPGFVSVGPALVPGNGGVLDLPLGAPADDVVCLVQATKAHAAGPDSTVATDVLLAQAVVLLVRPDPAPALQLTWRQPAGDGARQLRVEGGQPGVFYALQPAAAASPLQPPAYMHQRAADGAPPNKGVGQLAVEIDWVVAPDADPLTSRGDAEPLPPDQRPPAAPLLDLPAALADGAALALRAVKAQTGIDQALPLPLVLPADAAAPQVRAAASWVAPGAAAEVLVSASAAGEGWSVLRDGQPPAVAQAGTGGPLRLPAGTVDADTRLLVRLTAPAAPGTLALAREWVLALGVLPRSDLAWAPAQTSLASGEATEVLVQASQPGVRYRLQVDGVAVGPALAGDGAVLALPTGPVTASVQLRVTAQRSDGPGAPDGTAPVIVLDGAATLTVAP